MKVIDTITRTSLILVVIMLVTITAAAQEKLLLSEAVVTPTGGEYFEIYNGTGSTVDLTDYYVTDATNSGSSLFYYNIVLGNGTSGGSSTSDFNARFPAGAMIADGEYQTVALNGAVNFNTEFGVMPTYELIATDAAIPDMLEAESGSIGTGGGLSNSGEIVIFYYWDGVTDLVTDIDYMVWGDKVEAVDKSGIAIDGPDGDTTPSTYANDVAVVDQDVAPTHAFGFSVQRIDLTEGTQTMSGGNGVGGADETSENLSVTWHADSTATPNVAAQKIIAKLLISEVVVTPTFGEYVEIYNPTGLTVDLTNYYVTDAINSFFGLYYYNIVLGDSTSGGGSGTDFNARFPNGASILAGEYQTLALNGAVNFNATFGVMPTYELIDTDAGIPDMLEAELGGIGSGGGLSNNGEVVILYYWDGLSDLVKDIDYVLWGDKNEAVDKTGILIDGPDADATTSAYANDTDIASQAIAGPTDNSNLHADDFSAQRVDFDEGTQTMSGGNGVGGADETSENLDLTWFVDSLATPNAGPQEIILPLLVKLLISEFVTSPTGGEFVEIFNPGVNPVDLTNYYFTDATQGGGTTAYYQIVLGGTAGGSGVDNDFDFHVQFPAGAIIDAGEFQTLSLAGDSLFFIEYGVSPTYELFEDEIASDTIPDMLEIHTGSIGVSAGFSTDEVAILYYWDGMSDLVTDIDYVVWGDKAEAVDKSGVSIDGPDADATTSSYANDVAGADQDVAQYQAFGASAQRLDFTEGLEVQSGGNGVDGANEMSEDWSETWHGDSTATPNAAPQEIIIPDKVLISEIVVTPSGGEYAEIYNPIATAIDLTDYYLTDGTLADSGWYYYNIVLGNGTSGGANDTDFHVRFPAGATIDPGEYQTISLNGSIEFNADYGIMPTYELFEDDGSADTIPDMLLAETGSIGSNPGFSNSGEVVILYTWKGGSDLVTDVDYVVWGDKVEAVDKSGVAIDGPDAGTETSTYKDDIAVADQDVAANHAFGFSSQRIDFEEGIQLRSGGNGLLGNNETSENLSVTWYAMAGPTPNEPHDVDYVDMTIAEMEVDANGDFVPDRLGQMVRIVGVISTPNLQTDNTSHYLDDGTAGTDLFYFGQDTMFYMGDSVVIEGIVEFFAGLTEIIPPDKGAGVTVLSSYAEIRVQTIPVATIMDVVGEDVEGEIVALDEPVWQVDEAQWPSGISSLDLWITNGPDTVKMRLDSDMGMGGDPRPCGEFWLTGVVSQFTFNNPPNDNYSVIPRGFEDMVLLDAAAITSIDDLGSEVDVTFSASPRDTAGAADAITEYIVWAFYDDDTQDSLGAVAADNSAEYTLTATDPAQHAHLIVIANSAAGCGLWSESVDYDDIIAVGDEKVIPETYDLSANYPNPFNPTTKINYQLKENTQVKIVIFNLLGEQVATLVDREQTAGAYITEWNGLSDSRKALASGIYFYRMTAGDFTKTNKMILLK